MAPSTPKVLQFPVRNAYLPPRSQDSLARDLRTGDIDTQTQASRIAAQVEQEIAQQAARMATGARHSRVSRPVLMMPASVLVAEPAVVGAVARMKAGARRLLGR